MAIDINKNLKYNDKSQCIGGYFWQQNDFIYLFDFFEQKKVVIFNLKE
jgi:hypothetical protein